MQLQHNIYQVGGDVNGITKDEPGEIWNDCNSYILKLDDGLIMFDSGCGDTMDQIFENMRYWGLDPKDIKYCLLTHAHFDHAGGGHLLKQMSIKLIGGEDTAAAVKAGDERCCGYLYHKKFNPFELDRVLENEQEFELLGLKITPMFMPGHSDACTVYCFEWEGKKIMISGDVIGTLLIGDFGWSGSYDFNRQKYLKSLERMTKVEVDIMLPGHGMASFYNPSRRIEEVFNSALMQWRNE